MHGVMPYGQCHEVGQNQKPASCGFFHGQAYQAWGLPGVKCHENAIFTMKHSPSINHDWGAFLHHPVQGSTVNHQPIGHDHFLGLYHALPPH
jgi:hypothetical protein